jgi:hypothetical protein
MSECSVVDIANGGKKSANFNGLSLLDEPNNLYRKSVSKESAPDKELIYIKSECRENSVPDKDVSFDEDGKVKEESSEKCRSKERIFFSSLG